MRIKNEKTCIICEEEKSNNSTEFYQDMKGDTCRACVRTLTEEEINKQQVLMTEKI